MINKFIAKECIGCNHTKASVVETVDIKDVFCDRYSYPNSWWENRKYCPSATHIEKEVVKKQKVNPLKESKRQAKKRLGK